MNPFARSLLAWFDDHGRTDLPWQHPRSAYRVWVSEIMLQQTQVATVIGYFQRFVDALPTLRDLASASEDEVMALWSGLGYYRRARFLHAAAKACVERHDGELPRDLDALIALPGIGRSTAGAILAQAHGLRFPILDGNVKRVLSRYHGERGFSGESAVEKRLWVHAESHTPHQRLADYTQAIMDLGATLCTRSNPRCEACPLSADCVAYRHELTDQIPQARPNKKIPTRSTHMLVLRAADDRILLQRRDGGGVWSGLWSLPEHAEPDGAERMAGEHARIDTPSKLPGFTHTFSHYKLNVTPLLFANAQPHMRVADDERHRWCAAEEALALGLPAPVRTLLTTIWET